MGPVNDIHTLDYDFEDLIQSRRFIGRCLYLTFCQVMQARKLIPANAFEKASVDGTVKAHVLKSDSTLGIRLHKKFRGVQDAIMEGYLEELMMVVSQNEENTDDAVEVFSWKMNYGEGGHVSAYLSSSDKKTFATLRFRGKEYIKQQTRSILVLCRKLCRDILDPLPEDAFASFRISYTAGTPKGWQADGFHRSTTLYEFRDDPEDYFLAGCATEHEKYFLSVKTTFARDPQAVTNLVKMSDTNASRKSDSFLDESYHSLPYGEQAEEMVFPTEDTAGIGNSTEKKRRGTAAGLSISTDATEEFVEQSRMAEAGDDSDLVREGAPGMTSSKDKTPPRRGRLASKVTKKSPGATWILTDNTPPQQPVRRRQK